MAERCINCDGRWAEADSVLCEDCRIEMMLEQDAGQLL